MGVGAVYQVLFRSYYGCGDIDNQDIRENYCILCSSLDAFAYITWVHSSELLTEHSHATFKTIFKKSISCFRFAFCLSILVLQAKSYVYVIPINPYLLRHHRTQNE